MSEKKETYSIVDFLEKFKIHLLITLAIVVIAAILIAVISIRKNIYEEKAIILLEKSDESYTAIANPDEETKTSADTSDIKETDSKKNSIDDVINSLREILKLYPKSYAAQKAHIRLGILMLQQNKAENALKEFNKASLMKKKSYLTPLAYSYAASVAEDLAKIDETKKYYQTIVDIYPASIVYPKAQFSLGRLTESDKEIGEETADQNAIGFYKALVDNTTWSASPWVSLAKSRLIALGYYESTAETAELIQDASDTQKSK